MDKGKQPMPFFRGVAALSHGHRKRLQLVEISYIA
jgi:hypothetical protein